LEIELIAFSQELTQLYSLLHSDMYPVFVRQDDGDVIAVSDAPAPHPPAPPRVVDSEAIDSVMEGETRADADPLYAILDTLLFSNSGCSDPVLDCSQRKSWNRSAFVF
jgi:hypothetical protein